jgi:20S proteasome alpha/beta subunit
MTVVVAFLCSDGAVVAADSLVTTTVNGEVSAEHTCRKVNTCSVSRIMGWAGKLDLGFRFHSIMQNHDPTGVVNAIDHGISISKMAIWHYQQTALPFPLDLNTAVAFVHHGVPQCCVFDNHMQPLLLNSDLCFAALGTGKVAADPFLRFLIDTFCRGKQPTVSDARFLATWAVSYTIDSQPHVGGPIQMVTIEREGGTFKARELTEDEIGEHRQAVEEAAKSLRGWRDSLKSPKIPPDAKPSIPAPPVPPAPERDLQ